ncbi:MAG: helix-turn-helix transcriptional regulator [Actinophytocola sp.]|uniref:helix-turn-helix domain-containing protein n=1 Tax=Actinophytocola sp. TaxID=1872138 RepID=UPI003C7718F2
MTAQNMVTDKAFADILGQELKQARESRGLTKAQVFEHMPSGIGIWALMAHENGRRYPTVVRFVEICHVLDVAAE